MDAQDASDTAPTKPSDASSPRRRSGSPSATDDKPPPGHDNSTSTAAPSVKTETGSSAPAKTSQEPDAGDQDSDAETIVLPGKDGYSPSKVRKMRQDDRHDTEDPPKLSVEAPAAQRPEKSSRDVKPAENLKVRRLSNASSKTSSGQAPRQKEHPGDPSKMAAPRPRDDRFARRRHSSGSPHPSSDSETRRRKDSNKPKSDKQNNKDRAFSKRKASKTESDDDDEERQRRVRRQRTTSVSHETGRSRKDRSVDGRDRSRSPSMRSHRRSVSSQIPSHASGVSGQKKRRVPPPLHPTDVHSDDSDRSGSSMPRGSRVRGLATPATADSNDSPVKIIPHKKHLDAHGQTFLARACARGEYDIVKKRLAERPEDLNVADYAGNTPLQIAAINGREDIVKLLIDAGCNLECVNYDKDTPLLDAVDNGHLGVINLLLDAGVNPRKANVHGQEPIDRITEETENADEIRLALVEARKIAGERRVTSEDRHSHQDQQDNRDSHAPESPRHSPATLAGQSRRAATVRATKTRNDLLYMNLDDKTLRHAAGRGDEETVARILQVKDGFNDPESMVVAARGGHETVMQLLLGIGGANPDPPCAPGLQADFGTPILAAIGQENIKVVELLLEQGSFNPTKRFRGQTYYEVARQRQGTNWKEEEHLLRNAYDKYKRKDGSKSKKDPIRRDREIDEKRGRREDEREDVKTQKRQHQSPVRDGEPRKKSSASKATSPKERRRLGSSGQADDNPQKRAALRHLKEDRVPSNHGSDRESSPAASHKALKHKMRDSDHARDSSDGEAFKPRRKLVSKAELRGERKEKPPQQQQRRSSMASNTSHKEPSSPQEPRHDDTASDKAKMSERYHDRTKALKREESKDSAGSSDHNIKRHRSSTTPDRQSHGDKDDTSAPQKRRRLDVEPGEKRSKNPVSPEHRSSKTSSHDNAKASTKQARKASDDDAAKDGSSKHEPTRKEPGQPAANETPVHIKSEDQDVSMPDADTTDAEADRRRLEKKKRRKEMLEQDERKKREEQQRLDAKKEEQRKRNELKVEEEKRRADEEEERKKKRKQEAEAKRREEEAEKAKQEAVEKERLEKEEAQRKVEEKKRRQEQEEARRKEEEEQRKRDEEKRKIDEEERKKEEEERKQREEQERVRRQQLEREAAEAAELARQQREEDERKERERREKAHREEVERKRAAREAEQRRIREEQEKSRLERLPPLLRWLDTCPNPKRSDVARRMREIDGCRYDTLNSTTLKMKGTPEGREEWLLNTDVALILGEKDLNLSRYTAWDREPASELAKETIWRLHGNRYALSKKELLDLARETPYHLSPDFIDHHDWLIIYNELRPTRKQAWDQFRELDLFFVRVSDVMYTIPQIPHLKDVEFLVSYRECYHEEPAAGNDPPKIVRDSAHWQTDPDRAHYMYRRPKAKYYVNGSMVKEWLPHPVVTSSTPFYHPPVPRRGLIAVPPDDPEYAQLCQEQGIAPRTAGDSSPVLTNGSPPARRDTMSGARQDMTNGVNGASITNEVTKHAVSSASVAGGPNGASP